MTARARFSVDPSLTEPDPYTHTFFFSEVSLFPTCVYTLKGLAPRDYVNPH